MPIAHATAACLMCASACATASQRDAQSRTPPELFPQSRKKARFAAGQPASAISSPALFRRQRAGERSLMLVLSLMGQIDFSLSTSRTRVEFAASALDAPHLRGCKCPQ